MIGVSFRVEGAGTVLRVALNPLNPRVELHGGFGV